MRSLLILSVFGLGVAASAQTGGSLIEIQIQNAFYQQSLQQPLFLHFTENQSTGGTTVNYLYDATYASTVVNNRLLLQLNIIGYIGNDPAVRIVGDGVTLWKYDFGQNTYSAINYGSYSGAQPADYTARFFRYLGSLADGYSAYPIKFLQQVYSPSGAAYFSWAPGTTPVQKSDGSIVYAVGTRRTITFMPVSISATQSVIGSIDYHDIGGTSQVPIRTDWSLTPTTLTTLDSSIFRFTVPPKARAVAGPKLSW